MYPMLRALATTCGAAFVISCGSPAPSAPAPADTTAESEKEILGAEAPLVVFLGDSLTAGFGLSEQEAFPARVEARLRQRGIPLRVVNAGVSGDTSAGGLRRLDWILRQEPEVVVVGLGANDALRGQPLEATESNLKEIVSAIRESGGRVLLLGMRIPTNYGPDYAEEFAVLYARVARDMDVPFVPFLLEGVGGVPELNLPDGIHPNAAGHRKIAETVADRLHPLLQEGG